MGIVGGLQTLLGPVVGALVVVSMENALSGLAEAVLIVQGVVFVVVVMLFRRGIVGEINAKFKRPPLSPSAPPPEGGRRQRPGEAGSAQAREGAS
jgi:branched-chain amino acid transport system permease protein